MPPFSRFGESDIERSPSTNPILLRDFSSLCELSGNETRPRLQHGASTGTQLWLLPAAPRSSSGTLTARIVDPLSPASPRSSLSDSGGGASRSRARTYRIVLEGPPVHWSEHTAWTRSSAFHDGSRNRPAWRASGGGPGVHRHSPVFRLGIPSCPWRNSSARESVTPGTRGTTSCSSAARANRNAEAPQVTFAETERVAVLPFVRHTRYARLIRARSSLSETTPAPFHLPPFCGVPVVGPVGPALREDAPLLHAAYYVQTVACSPCTQTTCTCREIPA